MPLEVPSLQSQVRFAEYKVEVATDKTREEIEAALADLLAKAELFPGSTCGIPARIITTCAS